MSSDSQIDYNMVLSDLKAQRERIDAAIAGIEAMLMLRPTPGQPLANTAAGADLGPGAFLGMSIVDATKKFLKARRQNQRTEDILRALKDGGIAFSSETPINTVGSVLNRNWNAGGDIVRVERGVWGLAEWHPRLRKRTVDAKNGVNSSSEDNSAELGESDTTGESLL